jgi:hypothetical protein
LDFIDDRLTGCFNTKVDPHIGDMIRGSSGANYAFRIHDVAKTIALNEELVVAWFLIEFADDSTRDTWNTLG